MNIHVITAPYNMGQRDAAVGLGPTRYLEGGLGSVVQSASGRAVTLVPVDVGFSAKIEQVNGALTRAVSAAVGMGAFPLVMAGNCNSCLGTLPALRASGFGIIWFDAHPDFHSRESSISGNLDGMALGLATAQFVDESRTMLLGIRDVEAGERERVAKSRMRVVPASEWADGFVAKNFPQAERVYLHIDLDVIDAAVNPGVNFRGSGGLSLAQVESALRMIRGRYPIAAAALTNYNPERDVDGRSRDLGLALARLIAAID
ncbi:MAG: arginase family protein [Bryobacteraceae bacterium]